MWWSESSIYIIRSPNTDAVYISSTRMRLRDCLTGHRGAFKGGKSRPSKDVIGAGDAYIELLEKYPCDSKKELTAREKIVKQRFNIISHNEVNNEVNFK